MEYDAASGFGFLNTADGITFLVVLGVSAADEHDAHGSARIKLYLALSQIALGNALKEVHDVALQLSMTLSVSGSPIRQLYSITIARHRH